MDRAHELFERLIEGGSAAIQGMIEAGETEELFLDYKQATNSGNGTKLLQQDRNNLAKAISGFGNSEGGVIIWGVDCRPDPKGADIPQKACLISNVRRYRSWLEGATGGTTVPAHTGVLHREVLEPQSEDGFVITLIPKGMHAPYQMLPDHKYLMRSGSNFAPVSHSVLAGMFGRRPQPHITCNFVNEIEYLERNFNLHIDVLLVNLGMGIASDIFCNLEFSSDLGNSTIRVDGVNKNIWNHSSSLGFLWHSMMKIENRLAPEAAVRSLRISIYPRLPLSDIDIKLTAGASGCPPNRMRLFASSAALTEFHSAYTTGNDMDRANAEAELWRELKIEK